MTIICRARRRVGRLCANVECMIESSKNRLRKIGKKLEYKPGACFLETLEQELSRSSVRQGKKLLWAMMYSEILEWSGEPTEAMFITWACIRVVSFTAAQLVFVARR